MKPQRHFFPSSNGSPNKKLSPRHTLRSIENVAFRIYRRYAHWFFLVFLLTFASLQVLLIARKDAENSLATTEAPDLVILPPPSHANGKRPSIRHHDSAKKKPETSEEARNDKSTQNSFFDPSLNPVIPASVYKPTSARPLRVIFVGTSSHSVFLDGIDRSKYMKVIQTIEYDHTSRRVVQHKTFHSNPTNEPLLVVIDWASLSRDCHVLQQIWNDAGMSNATLPLERTHILFVDWSASERAVSCSNERWFPQGNNTRHARRNIVQGRHWNATRDWIEPGHVVSSPLDPDGKPLLHAPYFLREDFVDQLVDVTADNPQSRKTDVAHFWKKGDYSHYSFLRRKVSAEIVAFDESVPEKHLRWVVRRFMNEEWQEDDIDPSYVQQLVSSKIVVIAQKDEWEDHYRLMESLASGAMVLSDAMLAPPAGLKNRTNIVFYDSPTSLHRLVSYYLEHKEKRTAVARKGFHYAMGRQRSWHAMERLVFGHAFTQLDQPTEEPPKRKHPPKPIHRHFGEAAS